MTLEQLKELKVGDYVRIKDNLRDEEFLEASKGRDLLVPIWKEEHRGEVTTVTSVAEWSGTYGYDYVVCDVRQHGMWFSFEIELLCRDEDDVELDTGDVAGFFNL